VKLSHNGARLIESFEGFRSAPYRDAVGVWTIGFGSTRNVGPHTPPVTRQQAEARMMREIDESYGASVNALKLPLNQNQFDALVSFVYNVGPGGIGPNTTVGKRLRARDWHAAADALLAWDKAGGRPLAGLTRRRHAERALFLKPAAKPKAPTKRKTATARPRYLVIDGCPCPYDVAAQAYRVLRKAGQSANSIYRGDDAAALLHAHGKRTQREIHADPALAAISNPPGRSSHELRGDGVIGRAGEHLATWQVGVDSGSDDPTAAAAIERAARAFGWVVHHPYARGVERHHWNFKAQPKARNPLQAARLIAIRARLPRR
jgi:lysozyme